MMDMLCDHFVLEKIVKYLNKCNHDRYRSFILYYRNVVIFVEQILVLY